MHRRSAHSEDQRHRFRFNALSEREKIVSMDQIHLSVAVVFHYNPILWPFYSKWSKIMYFRPENDPFTRLGLRAKTGLFPTFPETPSPSKLKSKLKNWGLPQVPRKYYEEKMWDFVDANRNRAQGRPPPLQNIPLPIAKGPAKWLPQQQNITSRLPDSRTQHQDPGLIGMAICMLG